MTRRDPAVRAPPKHLRLFPAHVVRPDENVEEEEPEAEDGGDRLELCDLCAATFPKSEAARGYVPDPSSVNSDNDRFDGLRLIPACSEPHFAVVREIYRHRPSTYEELRAARAPGP